ncbi:dihydrolipoamide dehydrogenase [Cyanidioschyzon merolae strain 10D]|jgi:dihydrolipoamide dehydrogenase|uniref:Dihydrolipoyl dehydrogenase n=1 Tax=Cyanidioschyzon merolae (strain NIES-3377 / 10D) TaxID=280699 RepID=M1UTJ6_CYAM1|nr:dihydrolipoamide dehydrogenase [Cyanidioschyzon merolae strain 10D]BAM81126.1 dihydrolipoamide dehydrogenase [Cyanidioschyzon merolae strain 10D]|eukprot:XP_005537162.1 dihydrolipoamide dehydrogenase [Cyanidioschyzon merolae strain 10D]
MLSNSSFCQRASVTRLVQSVQLLAPNARTWLGRASYDQPLYGAASGGALVRGQRVPAVSSSAQRHRYSTVAGGSLGEFDVVVIGGGPGGYVAAIKAAQLGLKTACVEKRGSLGGTCLNVGCIPSKALLHSSHLYEEAKHAFPTHGIRIEGKVTLELPAMMKQKMNSVRGLTKGIEALFKKNQVTYVKGTGKLASATQIKVRPPDSDEFAQEIHAKNIIIATGSEPVALPMLPFDEKRVVSSTGALSLPTIPQRMAVIGGGYIGLEMGSVWRRLGAEVTVIEFTDRIVPAMDHEIGDRFLQILKKQGLKFKLGTKVTGAKIPAEPSPVTLELESAKDSSKKETFDADVVLVATGRRPYTAELGLEALGIELDDRGRIPIDDAFRTRVPNIYAIGDVVRGAMLAHKAEDEGIACAETIAGHKAHLNYDCIPGVVYTHPEVASVGKTEEELKAAGIAYNKGTFPFMANSRARTNDAGGDFTQGLVKVLAEKQTDRILGLHIIGPGAGEMIAEGVLAMEYGASSEDIARTCHAHPTLSEALREAAMATFDRPIHF